MITEGIERELSAEVVRSTSTGLLFLLAAFWLIYLLNRTWRQLLWAQGVAAWQDLQGRLGGHLETHGAGWRLRGKRADLQVRGGLWPVESRLKCPDGTVHKTPGVASPDWVEERLDPVS